MARDLIHYQVRRALEKDGWKVTADPFRIKFGKKTTVEIDLHANKFISFEKGNQQIFIEIKTFQRRSLLYTFYEALGQYLCYRDGLEEVNITKPVYLAIPLPVYKKIKKTPFIVRRINQYKLNLIIIDTSTEKIIEWKKL